ncbi:MAG: AzlC family ABC transporter permease [Anaerolineales bacterium]|jgi:4-azaleucine resistance transporter AzlC
MRHNRLANRRKEFFKGINRTLPLLLGAFPFGLIYGALAVSSGFSLPAVMAMSVFVFAGSSQFIAVGLYAAQAPVLIIILVTFVVNLRHLLYSLSLLPYLKHLPHRWRIPLSFWLTDETFAVSIFRYQESENIDHNEYFQLGSSLSMYLNWQFWSFVGMILGERIPNAQNWGLDVAMPITFIGMIIPFVKTSAMLICVLVSGALAILTYNLPYKLGIILSTLIGILAGLIWNRMNKQEKGEPFS